MGNFRTNREKLDSEGRNLFSRDCLEVNVEKNGKTLHLYVNHFKSMREGRPQTRARRETQARCVAEILDKKHAKNNYLENFVVLGDFNDYLEPGHALGPLVDHPELVNVTNRLHPDHRWTHYWNSGNEYHQIDFMLVSRFLAEAKDNKDTNPEIVRTGCPYRASL